MNDANKVTITEDNIALALPNDELKRSFIKERELAIKRFLMGRTPKDKIKWRESKKGGAKDIPYVTGSYLVRQIGLVTGFKWSHRVIDRRTLPDWWKVKEAVEGLSIGYFIDKSDKDLTEDESRIATITKKKTIELFERAIRLVPREIMTDVELTVYDAQDRQFIHTATGVNKVKYLTDKPTVPLSIGNAEKASETDAIKKAAANMGFCPDVYGNKEELEAMEEWVEE